MVVVKKGLFKENIKKCFKLAYSGEPILVLRKKKKNVVILSEKYYNDLLKAQENEKYLKMLHQSMKEANEGEIIVKTIEELEEIE